MFQGRLPEVPIRLSRATRVLGALHFRRTRTLLGKVKYTDIYITISNVYDRRAEEFEDTLIHEMIHLAELVEGKEAGSTPHGTWFRAQMNRINSDFKRNIHLSERLSEDVTQTNNKISASYFIVCSWDDLGVTVSRVSSTSILKFHQQVSSHPDIKAFQWYASISPLLQRFPRSRTLRFYKISSEDLSKIISHPSTIRMGFAGKYFRRAD